MSDNSAYKEIEKVVLCIIIAVIVTVVISVIVNSPRVHQRFELLTQSIKK